MTTVFARAWARRTAGQADDWPHPDMPWSIKRIIVDAIRNAWATMCADFESAGDAPLDCTEPQLTTLLQDTLNQMRTRADNTGGFTASMFQHVTRDASDVSFDGSHLEKKPDLAIRLISRLPGRGDDAGQALFVECKTVGPKHSASLYGCHGIRRFVDGEYAWQMRSAFMVAYADEDYSVPRTLEPHLSGCRS